jgi:hypothetical protein
VGRSAHSQGNLSLPTSAATINRISRTNSKRSLLLPAVGVLLFLSCAPKETKVLLGPSEALGTVLADEAARVAGARKQVAIISPDASWGAVSVTEEAFKNALKKQGFTTVTAKAANLGDRKIGPAYPARRASGTENWDQPRHTTCRGRPLSENPTYSAF